MSTAVLHKCLRELESETPRLEYIRGMLETLVEMQDDKPMTKESAAVGAPKSNPVSSSDDEAAILDAKAKVALKVIQEMGGSNKPE